MTDADVEYRFYVYEDDSDDPRFSFWMIAENDAGMALYDRPPEGAGMWLKPENDSDYEPIEPSPELESALADLAGDGLDPERLTSLDPHERHFVAVIHGTIEENPDGIPGPVWAFVNDCSRRCE